MQRDRRLLCTARGGGGGGGGGGAGGGRLGASGGDAGDGSLAVARLALLALLLSRLSLISSSASSCARHASRGQGRGLREAQAHHTSSPKAHLRLPVARSRRAAAPSSSLRRAFGRANARLVCFADGSSMLPPGSAAREAASAVRAGVAAEASCDAPSPGQSGQLGPQPCTALRHLSHLATFGGRPHLRGASTGITSLAPAAAPAGRASS